MNEDWLNVVSICSEVGSMQFLRVSKKFWKTLERLWNGLVKKALKSSDVVLSFLLFIPFPDRKHSCLHAKSRYK